MSANLWTRFSGATQGRVKSAGWVPPDGVYDYVLGSDRPGLTGRLKAFDFAELAQTGSFEDAVMKVRARLRPPATVPDGAWWHASIRIDDAEILGWDVFPSGGTRDLAGLTWDVSHLAGAHKLAFRLELHSSNPDLEVEAELPAFYFDDITFTPATAIFVGAQEPGPGATGILASAPIELAIFNPAGGSGTSPTGVSIYVEGLLAYSDAGGFTAAFDGPQSQELNPPTTNGRAFVIDSLANWGDEAVVLVRVVAHAAGASGNAVDTTYHFTAERTSGPAITDALATGIQTLRVTFDEALLAEDPDGAADALNPANYTITRRAGVIAAVNVASVALVSSTSVDLTTDVEMTAGGEYTLLVGNVDDLHGNVADDAPVDFFAFTPPAPAGRSFDIYEMLPQKNRSEDVSGDLLRFIQTIQEPTNLLLGKIDRFTDIIDVDIAPEPFVDAMLDDLGNPFEFELTLLEKRQLVQLLVPIYKQKGTDAGIINAVRLFLGFTISLHAIGFGTATIPDAMLGVDWVLGSSELYDRLSFEVTAPTDLTDDQIARMNSIINYMKRAETHYVRLTQSSVPVVTDPVQLGFSGELGDNWLLH